MVDVEMLLIVIFDYNNLSLALINEEETAYRSHKATTSDRIDGPYSSKRDGRAIKSQSSAKITKTVQLENRDWD